MLIGFKWIIDKKLAGSGKPGLYKDAEDDIESMRNAGITTIFTLTQKPLDDDLLDKGFEIINFPISDMGVPMPKHAREVCCEIKRRIEDGETVLVHCKAGLGRTGTILACVLIEQGFNAEEAILEVRKNIKMAIQNSLQENFIKHYEKYQISQTSSTE